MTRLGGKSDGVLMGVDLGAGSLKSSVISLVGAELGSASREIDTRSPHPGWSEQAPEDWWTALCDAVPRSLAAAGVRPEAVIGVAFSAGAHTPVLEDAQGRVIRPAILWNDQRSGEESRILNERFGARILEVGCNRAAPTWTLPQLLWLRRHEPECVKRVRRLYVAKDWLRSRLTGSWETDPTEAVGTLLFDARAGRWSEELCAMGEWDTRTLPPLVAPTTVVGTVSARAAAATGLAEGTPVICGTSDTSAEIFGVGALGLGDAAVKLATAGTVSIIGAQPHRHASLINYPFAVPGRWYTIGATNSCGSSHRWLRDRLFAGQGRDARDTFAEMDRMAAGVALGADGLLFHPYLQGERVPYWDSMLRADFVGLSMRHDRAHLVRAVYEGIAMSLRDVLELFREQGFSPKVARIIGGGARSATWRQILADVLGMSIELPKLPDASFGTALLAGVGAGAFDSELSAAKACVRVVAECHPDSQSASRYDELFTIYKDTQAALVAVNHRLVRFAEAKKMGESTR